MTLILHCGGKPATYEEVCAVEPPQGTASYRPVPHRDIIALIEEEVERNFRLMKPERSLGLANEGQRLFGTLTYELVDEETRSVSEALSRIDLSAFDVSVETIARNYKYSVAFRNSYDKSMSLGICGGSNTTACDNLMLTGSDFRIMLKHAPNVWDKAVAQAVLKIRSSMDQFIESAVTLEQMRGRHVSEIEAYETIGVAQGTGILTANQTTKALREYQDCKKAHEAYVREHEQGDAGSKASHVFAALHGTAFALYQHFTEALKLGADVSRKMDKYTGVSRLFEERRLAPKIER